MEKLRITQIRSGIDQPERQKRTLKALGITKTQRPIEVTATPQIMGMIEKVRHMLLIEKV